MHVQIVNFNLEGIGEEAYVALCNETFAPAIAGVPGLLYKIWLADPAANTYGGVYAWRDRQAMQDCFDSDLFKAILAHPNLRNITSKDFAILEGPTGVTRGLTMAAAP